MQLAAQRHLDDLKDGPARGLRWDPAAAQRAIEFFPDVLRLAEGEHAGQPFELTGWESFIVGSLFGWKGADGWRRFRHAYIEVGKGNGKTPLAAGIGVYMLTADGEAGACCFAAATTREQADILFQDAVKMVAASPGLSSRVRRSGRRKVFNLAYFATGSFFRPISAERRGLDGKRVHYAALDEVHEHPNGIVVDKMRAGTKGRRQALIFEITNSGYDRHSVCWEHHEYSLKILECHVPNDDWFAFVAGLDEGDDWRDPKVWVKANPNLGVSVHPKYLEEQVREAEGMPGKENIVKRLNFCIWTEQATRVIPMLLWDDKRMAEPVDPQSLVGRSCVGGMDLARVNDLSAFVLLFPPEQEFELTKLLVWFWVPEDDIRVRAHRDHVPYDVWVREGLVTATPGPVTDFKFIGAKIVELSRIYDIRGIGFDRTFAGEVVQYLIEEGLTMVEVGQGFLSMAAPTAELLRLIKGKQLQHGGHKVLRWNASNFVVKQDPAGELKPDKEKSTERIDGMVAICDGLRILPTVATSYTDPNVMVV